MATNTVQPVMMVQQPMTGQQPVMMVQQPAMTGGTGQVQTVVVVQQPQQQTVVVQQPAAAADEGNRYARWNYLIFMIGMMVWQFIEIIVFLIFTFAPGGWGALFFFCGFVPSVIVFTWAINDSTVFCSNPGTGRITKMCCCDCISGPLMSIPMIVAAVLRLILWLALFGMAADALSDDFGDIIDNLFWFVLAFIAVDVGPMILLAIDWWFYYGRHDYDALFGVKYNPLRCVMGLAILILVHSWSLIAVVEGDDVLTNELWAWVVHGSLATAMVAFNAFLNFSGSLTGPYVSSQIFRIINLVLGIGQTIMFLVVWGYLLSIVFDGGGWLIIYGIVYSSLTVPLIWALCSFKYDPDAAQQQAQQQPDV